MSTQTKRKPTKATPRKNTQARSTGSEGQSARSAGASSQRSAASKSSTRSSKSKSSTVARTPPRRSATPTTSRRISEARDVAVRAVTDTASDIGSGASRAASATGTFLAANALPLTLGLLGLGTGILALSVLRRRRHNEAVLNASLRGEPAPTQPTLDEDARELLARGREQLLELARRTKEGAQQVGGRVQETAARVGDRAAELGQGTMDGLVTAEERAREFVKEHPVATSAAAVAAGIGIGMAIPDSQLEKRVLGPLAERAGAAFNEAKSGVQSAYEAAKEVKNDLIAQVTR